MDCGDALRILRGERCNDAGAVDAERSEGLQVRLDAGAAARIRAGDGDGDRDHVHPLARQCRHRPLPRKPRAAAAGSGASESAEITATPSLPAAMTSPALPPLMPEIAQIGMSASRARTMLHHLAQAIEADRRLGVVLGAGGEDRADRHVIEQIERRFLRVPWRGQTEPDDGAASEQQPRFGRRHIVLPDMHAVSFGG